jgi:hypothetical protein
VIESPAQFEYAIGSEQMDYKEPMSQILTTEEIITYDYGTLCPTKIHRPNISYVPLRQ